MTSWRDAACHIVTGGRPTHSWACRQGEQVFLVTQCKGEAAGVNLTTRGHPYFLKISLKSAISSSIKDPGIKQHLAC